jgi:hypothetical protein
MEEMLRVVIAGIAAGAAAGVEALRRCGIDLELDVYSVEARLEGAGGGPVASVRLDFVVPTAPRG